MNTDQYLKMVDTQISEAEETLKSAEKAYKEAKAKHFSLVKSRESYIQWLLNKGE